jgi:uncharacterized membrane protein
MAENRVETIERQVRELTRRLERLEGSAPASSPPREAAPTPREAGPRPAAPSRPSRSEPLTATSPARPRPGAPPGAPGSGGFDSLLTARTLAWAGGIVLLLGLGLFFAIAIDRGWIDETARVILGGLFSLGLLGASAVLRERYGRLEAGLVGAGAAIGGLFFTDLAASSFYDLIPDGLGIGFAAAIAVLAVYVALVWETEAIGALGLTGVIVAAPVIAHELSLLTIGVVAIALASAQILMLARGWQATVGLAVSGAGPQALAWMAMNSEHHVQLAAVGVVFWLLFAVPGLAWSLTRRNGALDPNAGYLVVTGAIFAVATLFLGIDGTVTFTDGEGWALAGLGALYVLVSPALRFLAPAPSREGGRDLRTLHWAIGLAMVAGALCILLDHRELLAAFGGGAAILALVANRLRDERLELASLTYLGAAGVYLMFQAPPTWLFDSSVEPANGLVDVLVVAASAGVTALLLRDRVNRLAAAWSFGALAVYLGSLGIVSVLSTPNYSLALGDGLFGAEPGSDYQRAQTVVSIFWGLTGIGALLEGLRRDAKSLRAAGGLLLALAIGKAFIYDLSYLTAFARALSFLGLGSVLLVAAFFYQRLSERLRGRRED